MKEISIYNKEIASLICKASNGVRDNFTSIAFTINYDSLDLIFVTEEVNDECNEFVEDIVVDLEVIIASEKLSNNPLLGIFLDELQWNIKVIEKDEYKIHKCVNMIFI